MHISRCFHSWGSLSRIPGSRGLVSSPLPTPWHKPRCRKCLPPCTLCYYCWLKILATLLSSYLPALFLWCFSLARTCEKRHRSFIVLVIRVFRLGYPTGAKLGKISRTLLSTSDCIWFWYICYSTKLSCWERNS